MGRQRESPKQRSSHARKADVTGLGRWRNTLLALTVSIVAASLSQASVVAAEPGFLASHAQALAKNPEGVRFAIELVDGRTRFRVGELIPLDLVYGFEESGAYQINDALAQGSGVARLLEVFRVAPHTGIRERTLDEPNFHRWAGGTPLDARADHAYRYRVYLNEWTRFDEPGKYRFYGSSARVWKPKIYPHGDNELRLTSNMLELEITPATAEWQDDQLRAAMAILNRAAEKTDAHQALRREALRRLRYLDTEAATRELARRQTGGDDEESYEIGMGLHESRYKAAAVEELRRHLDAPDFVMTEQFVLNLASLAADGRVAIEEEALGSGKESLREAERHEAKRRAVEHSLLARYSAEVWDAAEHKEPVVRARCLLEQYQLLRDYRVSGMTPLSAEKIARLRAAVLPVFHLLTPRDQYRVLEVHWRRLGGVDLLPALRQFIATAPERTDESDWRSPIDVAFERVVELAPDEGHALILAEIRRAKPRASAKTLTLLPDQPIPELDELLAARLEHSRDEGLQGMELAAALVARYGSPAIYDRVRHFYGDRGGRWACTLQGSMLAYFLRHRPQEGTQLVEQALQATTQTGCFRSVLTTVARVHMSTRLERIAVDHLDDENAEIAADAIALLATHGSAAAESALWKRFESWHDKWKDHVDDLKVVKRGVQPDLQVRLERSLIDGLALATNWIADRAKLEHLRTLCLTRLGQQTVDVLLDIWSQPLSIYFSPGIDSEFDGTAEPHGWHPQIDDDWCVAQYHARSFAELKTLLARFPAGTAFGFQTGMLADEPAEARLFDALEKHLASHGLKLVKMPRPVLPGNGG